MHCLKEKGIVVEIIPGCKEKFIREDSKEYPVSVNGKLRTTINISLTADRKDVEKAVIRGRVSNQSVMKIIYVKNKMIYVVT